MSFLSKWTTMTELAERVGVNVASISKALNKGRIAGTRWKSRVFFSKEQVEFAERLYARSSRRGGDASKKGVKKSEVRKEVKDG